MKLSVGRGSRGVGTIGGLSQGFLSGSWIGVGLDISHFSVFSSTMCWLSIGEALLLSLTRLSLSLQTSVMFTSQGQCDDSISVSLPQIPCLSCVCKLGPSLIVISSRHGGPSQSQPEQRTGKARPGLVGPELGVLAGGSQWGGCVRVLRYHSPRTRRWEAAEKGTRHRPNHIKIWLRINQGTHRRGRAGGERGGGQDRTHPCGDLTTVCYWYLVWSLCHNTTLHSLISFLSQGAQSRQLDNKSGLSWAEKPEGPWWGEDPGVQPAPSQL